MRWAVLGSFGSLQRFASIGPIEGMGHRLVIVIQKLAKLVLEDFHRGEVSPSDDFPHDDPEHRFNLIQPRTVFGQVHEANAMRAIRQEFATARLIF